MRNADISQALAYPFIDFPLSEVKSIATLIRHAEHAEAKGFPHFASEYRAEIARRETNEHEVAA